VRINESLQYKANRNGKSERSYGRDFRKGLKASERKKEEREYREES
jgi:hypothetical protein